MALGKSAERLGRALVTGASSGIGAAFATRLARDGYDVILVARRRSRLEELAARLRAGAGVKVEVVVADLTKGDELRAVEALIRDSDGLDLLVNNAGCGVFKAVAETEPSDLEEMILLNVLALTRLTRAALPGMLARGSGTIINLASGLAYVPNATRGTYSGTKAFVINFTRALHQEVAGKGIRAQALCPPITITEIHQRTGTDLSKIPPERLMTAEDVADASLTGLELGELVCMPGLRDTVDLTRCEEAQGVVGENYALNGRPVERYRAR